MFDPNPPVAKAAGADLEALVPAAVAASGVLPARGVPMSTSLLPMSIPGADEPGLMVVTGLEPFQSAVSPVPTSDVRVNVFVGVFDPRARPLSENRFSLSLAPPRVAGKHYDVVSPLTLKPGTYEIRVGASTADGRSGSSTSYVDIPDFKKEALSLSGVALTTVPAGATVAIDRADDLLPFVPTTQRVFRQTDTIRTFLRVYRGGSDPVVPVDLAVSMVDTHGQSMLTMNQTLDADRFKGDRAAEVRLELPLSGLVPGDYLLSFAVAEGKTHARRDVRLSVR
jgi:hypothetical protein